MAEQAVNDAVKEAQSVGRPVPIDDSASTTTVPAVNGDLSTTHATAEPGSLQVPSATSHPHADADADLSEHSATDSHAIADASGGSDTDISRPGSVDQSKREPNHVRTNSSVKKPSLFKSVSVTKNFLAKSAAPTPVARLGDRTTPLTQANASTMPIAKPRLVAKLGTANAPRVMGKVNGTSSGPDASKVWNKNQPVPPPPPKQFTDEELKQQYGIHLATRLQADEAGKEAKWADIDDDEDDWAPETVQWMDGTKSSVAVIENPPASEEPMTIMKPEPPISVSEPMSVAGPASAPSTSKASVTGGTKTILKPGTHAQPSTTRTSLVLKGQPEKPTLVAKPSATEKKSPWATLPPVEKVSPIHINPPLQPPPQRFSQREPYGHDAMPPHLAKEIAPDDFNRSWRDERGVSRELFNSHSGRYEPVNDMRKNSARDGAARQQPSLLQRPSQEGPAEPSAAFQTSRASGDVPTWGRRRNSSNVSSGNMRRMSIDKRAQEMPNASTGLERRGSQSINGFDAADGSVGPRRPSFVQAASPSAIHAHPASPYGSVASSANPDPPTPSVAPVKEDPVEVQKRLMAEKIERARLKKQQEQEAEKKAEAERKERIAKKLAAMGPPAEPKVKVSERSPSPVKEEAGLSSAQSPPKPPIPTADGEVTQYGMMKVHQPQTIKKPATTEAAKASKSREHPSGSSLPRKPTEEQVRSSPTGLQQSSQAVDALLHGSEKNGLSTEQSRDPIHNPDRPVQLGSKPQATWSSSSAPQPRPWTSQVWGPPPTKERALGNGTFESGYDRSQPRSVPPQQLPVQPPTTMAPLGLNVGAQTSIPSPSNQLPPSQPMYPHSVSLPVQVGAPTNPGPIAPLLAKGWGNFEADIAKDDANLALKTRQDRERIGEAFRPEIRETYKDQRGQAQTTLHNKVAGSVNLSDAATKKDDVTKLGHDGSSSQQGLSQNISLQQAAGPRASRFFPRPIESTPRVTTYTSAKADSPPPPPETETHPVHVGDSGHPLVRLPKPSPVVRLPPSATGSGTQAVTSVSIPSRGQPLGAGARPLAMNPEWQARFNKLLEKPGTAPVPANSPRSISAVSSGNATHSGALAPAALSKASLDVRGALGPATVSLPSAARAGPSARDRGQDILTRRGAEALFEDREFGSLPTVKLSKIPHLASTVPAVSPPRDELYPRFKRLENPFTIRRLEAFDLEKVAQMVDVVVRLSNMREAVTRSMPRRRRGPKSSNQPKPKGPHNVTGVSAGGPKDRLRKPSQQSSGDRSNSAPRSPAPTAPWSSNTRSIPAASTQTTWARRAAASVH